MPIAPLSTWTLKKVRDRILSRMTPPVTNPDSQVKVKILNELNFQVSELFKRLNSDELSSYILEKGITFTNNLFDMRSISDFDSFFGLRELSYGDILVIPTDKLEKLFHSSYYDNSFMCGLYGDNVKLFVGTNMTTSDKTFNLKYIRKPIPALIDTDYIDLRDAYIERLINGILAVMTGNEQRESKPKE